jgi:hypothetical protein
MSQHRSSMVCLHAHLRLRRGERCKVRIGRVGGGACCLLVAVLLLGQADHASGQRAASGQGRGSCRAGNCCWACCCCAPADRLCAAAAAAAAGRGGAARAGHLHWGPLRGRQQLPGAGAQRQGQQQDAEGCLCSPAARHGVARLLLLQATWPAALLRGKACPAHLQRTRSP